MDIKILIQALTKPWLIEEEAAYHYAGILEKVLSNDSQEVVASDYYDDPPYRVNEKGQKSENGSIMVLPVYGPMMKSDWCGSMGTAEMANRIRQGNADPSVKGFVLDMDTPGGTVDGTEEFANTIANSKKPVIAHGSLMASAGYWVASQATEIHLSGKTGMAGSIGTMAVIRDFRGAMEQRGMKEHVVFATRSKDKNRAHYEAMDGKPDAYINEFLNPLNSVFESAIIKGRSGKIDLEKEDVATGKMYTGSKAVSVGLADKIGSLETAIKRSLQLSNQTFNNTHMAFEKTMTVAKANEFAVIDGGFQLTEENLNSIEAAIASHEGIVISLNGSIASGKTALETAQATILTHQETISNLNERIQELEALGLPGAKPTVKSGADNIPGEATKKVSPVTAELNKIRAMKGLKPIATILIFFFALLFQQTAFSQTVMTPSADSNINAMTTTHKIALAGQVNNFDLLTITALVTKISGTVAATAVLRGSIDDVTYFPIGADTLTVSDATKAHKWELTGTRWKYYRVDVVSTGGTQKSVAVCKALGRKNPN